MQNIHVHVWDESKHFSDELKGQFSLSRGKPLPMTFPLDHYLTDMKPFDRVVVFGLKARRSGFWVPDEYVAQWVKQAPRHFVGFASNDPTQKGHLKELRHGIEDLGLKGVKMGPMYAGFDPRDKICHGVYEYCQRHGLPILFHTGTTFVRNAPLEFTRPWLFDEVAMRYPELRMILAHLGHPFEGECLATIRKHPHVYADIAALFYRPWQLYNMLVLAEEYRVTHKLLFGTDFPFALSRESIRGLRQVNHVIGSATLPRISKATIDGILQRDAFSLLGIKP